MGGLIVTHFRLLPPDHQFQGLGQANVRGLCTFGLDLAIRAEVFALCAMAIRMLPPEWEGEA